MLYKNPIIKGFYPDPSVCKANDKYYLVTSTFQYFPGVPIFESSDLVNWIQVGNCLTRPNQVELDNVESSGGIFAPTIRFHNEKFYMTTTNSTTHKHFIVWTDDVKKEWSDPIFVEQDGIDPSLLFENDKVYFTSNGIDDFGNSGVIQSEIDIKTGKKLTPTKCIWKGTGGRFLESPHLYHMYNYYYLIVAEGGTEYGHMVTYARAKDPFGPFESYSLNPVLTNRNLGGFEIQGVGHGDLIQAPDNNWYLIHLAFRQIGKWDTYHHLGRETFMTPVIFTNDGWFVAGKNGTTEHQFNIVEFLEKEENKLYTFDNTNFNLQWLYLRHPKTNFYSIKKNCLVLKGSNISLDIPKSPTFIGIRQIDFNFEVNCDVEISGGEAGITIYMDENHHFDIALCQKNHGVEAIGKLNIGTIKHISKIIPLTVNRAKLIIKSSNNFYNLYLNSISDENNLGCGQSKYLSSEVAGGFTGVLIGLFAYDKFEKSSAIFTNFSCKYE